VPGFLFHAHGRSRVLIPDVMQHPGTLLHGPFDPAITIVNKAGFVMLTLLSPGEHVLNSGPTRSISPQDMFACLERAMHLAAHETRC
jgi:hypothetical protein